MSMTHHLSSIPTNSPVSRAGGSAGFTLIELIVVVVILGILSATALPKFIDLGKEARGASLQGLAGSINSAVQFVSGAWMVRRGATVTMTDGTVVTVDSTSGFPTSDAAGIGRAMNCGATTCGGFQVNFGPLATNFYPAGAAFSGTCQVEYDLSGNVTTYISGC